MTVPFNDLSRRPSPERSAARVWERGFYILGPELDAFEREFAAYCGAPHATGVANGTDALELALRAAGVRPGDEVAAVANAGMYATAAIRACAAQPLYVDVDPLYALMSPASLDSALGPATRAVVVTHLYGCMAPLDDLLAIAAARGIPVVEDCAQAHGAARHGRKAGAWGLAGCFSFYPTKNLGACGDAGAVITSDADFAARLTSLRQYGWAAKYESVAPGGRNSRLDEVQAAILRDRLPLLDSENARRREIACRYNSAFAGRLEVAPAGGSDCVAHLYTVRTSRRDELRAFLAARGIRAEIHYPIPDHLQPSQRGLPGRSTALPETERCARETLSLPCFPELDDTEIDAVIAAILEWCR
jgi:dTDP-3-amino-2,3,6-trideoxy-4-keto-D-glucose/dTDP-3-amino-3,4,6-trideoxy-alpha-D-glucose/dTDP-2,6-dideoxy-D-kanosamine transaminase